MKEIILETLIDSLKLLPFLFITFLIIEYIEHKLNNKSKNKLSKTNKMGPFIGSLLGAFPQCGFSVAATNLYITRIISLGTLISIYLSTSDEMLPILIANQVEISVIIKILLIKITIGMLTGFIIDLVLRNKQKQQHNHEEYEICEKCHCGCENSILKSSIKHTLSTILFIIIVSFILNIIMTYYGEDFISKIFLNNKLLAPIIASLVGLIPNCASSVALTQLYLSDVITLGTTIAGLLSASGVGLLVLFKQNKNIKENLIILGIIYFIGVISGIILNIIG